MSFNVQHITVENYSEAFLLYVDGELTPQEMDAVDAFVAAHPQYAEELELLLTARLGNGEDMALTAAEKEQLLAPQMKAALAQEDLLLYLDGELTAAEAAQVQQKISADPALQQLWQQLQATKLQANAAVVFPNKELLLRKESGSVRRIGFYLRAAVVVGVVAAAGLLLTQQSNNGTDVASNNKPAVTPPVNNTRTTLPTHQSTAGTTTQKNNYASTEQETAKPVKVLEAPPLVAVQKQQPRQKASPKKSLAPAPQMQQPLVALEQPRRSNNLPAPEKIIEPTVVETTAPAVTTNTPPTYIQTETAQPTNTAPTFAAVQEKDKRGSVRGLLRKATRFIERRTGAELTDEEDRLLIGALAVKLK